ncbi:MAG: DivIVA domain-containing protein [Streptosporangiaceae bacterium]
MPDAPMLDTQRFPHKRWAPSYQMSDVDQFMARIEATLAGALPPDQAITAADVRAIRFRVTRRGGYDERLVDDALDRYAEELDRRPAQPG